MSNKMVIIVSEGLALGVAANIVGLLGISIGYHVKGIVGPDVTDSRDHVHPGMSMLGLPILNAPTDILSAIHKKAAAADDLRVFDVTDSAISSRDYAAYTKRLHDPDTVSKPLGIAIFGPRKQVDRVAGQLGLFK